MLPSNAVCLDLRLLYGPNAGNGRAVLSQQGPNLRFVHTALSCLVWESVCQFIFLFLSAEHIYSVLTLLNIKHRESPGTARKGVRKTAQALLHPEAHSFVCHQMRKQIDRVLVL